MKGLGLRMQYTYLRIINQNDDLTLERIIGVPKGVGESTINQIYTYGKINKLLIRPIIKLLEKEN